MGWWWAQAAMRRKQDTASVGAKDNSSCPCWVGTITIPVEQVKSTKWQNKCHLTEGVGECDAKQAM